MNKNGQKGGKAEGKDKIEQNNPVVLILLQREFDQPNDFFCQQEGKKAIEIINS